MAKLAQLPKIGEKTFSKECLWGSIKFAVDFLTALVNWERLRKRDFILDLYCDKD